MFTVRLPVPETDRLAAEELAGIAGIKTHEYAMEMFAAGSDLSSKSPEEIFYQDFKKFVVGEQTFGVGQITAMTSKELEAIKGKAYALYAESYGRP